MALNLKSSEVLESPKLLRDLKKIRTTGHARKRFIEASGLDWSPIQILKSVTVGRLVTPLELAKHGFFARHNEMDGTIYVIHNRWQWDLVFVMSPAKGVLHLITVLYKRKGSKKSLALVCQLKPGFDPACVREKALWASRDLTFQVRSDGKNFYLTSGKFKACTPNGNTHFKYAHLFKTLKIGMMHYRGSGSTVYVLSEPLRPKAIETKSEPQMVFDPEDSNEDS